MASGYVNMRSITIAILAVNPSGPPPMFNTTMEHVSSCAPWGRGRVQIYHLPPSLPAGLLTPKYR
jgi:hypothetical protein